WHGSSAGGACQTTRKQTHRRIEHERLWRGYVSIGRGALRAASALTGSIDRRRVAGVPRRRGARARADTGDKASGPYVRVRTFEVRSGTAMSIARSGLPSRDVGIALLQCVRTVSGAVESVHWRAGDLRRPHLEWECPSHLRGWTAAARLRERVGRRGGVPPRAYSTRDGGDLQHRLR